MKTDRVKVGLTKHLVTPVDAEDHRHHASLLLVLWH